MINLLPTELQQEIKAKRINSILLRYLVALGIATGFLVIAILASSVILGIVKNSTDQTYHTATAGSTSAEPRINNANLIMSRQKSYSKVLTGVAGALPDGLVLDEIKMSKSSIDSSVNIKLINKIDMNSDQIKSNLEASALINTATVSQSTGDKLDVLLTINPGAMQ